MNTQWKTKLVVFIKTWTMVENIIFAAIFILAILVFCDSAIYTAAHNVKF